MQRRMGTHIKKNKLLEGGERERMARMRNKIILSILFIFIIFFIGCTDVHNGQLYVRSGYLNDIVKNTFILDNDYYFEIYNLGHYNNTELQSYINHNVKIKTTNELFNTLIEIKIID